MTQDLLSLVHRISRPVAPVLGPLRAVARRAFRFAVGLRYGSQKLMRARKNGRVYVLSPELALRGEHEEFETIEWFRQVTRPGDCAIDVGANLGLMTLELAELVGPEGRVIAIEPAPGNCRLLRRHVEANGYAARVSVEEAACTDADGGSVELLVVGDAATAIGNGHTLAGPESVRRREGNSNLVPHQVPAVSLDGLCASRGLSPRVLKIDVEGAELSVLRGARRVLEQHRPAVRVAFHPFGFEDVGKASDELRELFKQARYRFDGPVAGSLSLAEYVALPE